MVTPAMCPFRSAIVVSVSALCGEVTSTRPGNLSIVTKATNLPSFGRHLNRVIVEAGHDVRAAADQRLQRLGAAGEVLQLRVDALLAIEAELLRERRRQVDHLVLAADRDSHVAHAVRSRARTRHAADRNQDTKDTKDTKESDRDPLCPSCPLCPRLIMPSTAATIAPVASRPR